MISEPTTRLLLVRSGGRCAVCYADLFTSGVTWKTVNLAERAHIVGRSTSDRSPRGGDLLPLGERDEADNLLLLCPSCHKELDHPTNIEMLTVDQLCAIKNAHENRIQQLLAIPPDNQTTVLRMQGHIGDAAVHIDRTTTASAVLSQNRFASFPFNTDRTGLEIDLRQLANPCAGNHDYYTAAKQIIDAFFTRQFTPAVDDGTIQHLSVFGLARWPLLVYLGACLGDKVNTDIYQRHRSTEQWGWPDCGNSTEFAWEVTPGDDAAEAVLVLSLSAGVHIGEIPVDLRTCSAYRVTPVGNPTPHYDVIGSPPSLRSAEQAFREILADIEQYHKQIRRLHVLGAAPLSACISLGRVSTRGIHPTLVLYDRVDNTYAQAMEIN